MKDVDVHILTMPGDNSDWFDQCLQSLETEPVNVYVRPGIKDDIGNARANAFLYGTARYVSFVDPDDYVLPGGFAECLNRLREETSVAACTAEIRTGVSGEVLEKPFITRWVHHLIVLERAVVLKHLDFWRNWKWPSKLSEGKMFVSFLSSQNYGISIINEPYYVWRRHHKSFTVKSQVGDHD